MWYSGPCCRYRCTGANLLQVSWDWESSEKPGPQECRHTDEVHLQRVRVPFWWQQRSSSYMAREGEFSSVLGLCLDPLTFFANKRKGRGEEERGRDREADRDKGTETETGRERARERERETDRHTDRDEEWVSGWKREREGWVEERVSGVDLAIVNTRGLILPDDCWLPPHGVHYEIYTHQSYTPAFENEHFLADIMDLDRLLVCKKELFGFCSREIYASTLIVSQKYFERFSFPSFRLLCGLVVWDPSREQKEEGSKPAFACLVIPVIF